MILRKERVSGDGYHGCPSSVTAPVSHAFESVSLANLSIATMFVVVTFDKVPSLEILLLSQHAL